MAAMQTLRPRAIKKKYAGNEERPLGSFIGLMGVYGTLVLGGAGYLKARKVELPDRLPLTDLAMVAVATHKVARLLAKDPVSSPLRAPFTRFEGQSGEAEVQEDVIGTGPQKALGELLTCPFCLDQWIGSAFLFGLLIQPKATRVAAALFTTVTAADVLQFGYDALQS
jgi:hypothetical protein